MKPRVSNEQLITELLSFASAEKYPWFKEGKEKHFENLKEFKRLAEKENAKLIVVISAAKYLVYDFLEDEKKQMIQSALPTVYRERKELQDFFRKEAIEYIDLLPEFRKYADRTKRKYLDSEKDLFWKFDGHWNIKGNHLAGLFISRYLIENNIIKVYDKENRLKNIGEKLNSFNNKKGT